MTRRLIQVVVPCYNEAGRLDLAAFARALSNKRPRRRAAG
jgi:hypothetical protein